MDINKDRCGYRFISDFVCTLICLQKLRLGRVIPIKIGKVKVINFEEKG